jgi:hypothetical protein
MAVFTSNLSKASERFGFDPGANIAAGAVVEEVGRVIETDR